MTEGLSAVVAKHRAEVAIASLRAEGVYDDDRSVQPRGEDCVAIPVTERPERTAVLNVVREAGDPRLRTLEDHLRERGWDDEDLEHAPGSWAVIGSVILVDVADVPAPEEVGETLLALHGEADTVLARGGVDGEHREPAGLVIAGEGDTETVHVEHGTTYAMDLDEVMFSPGNKAERARMGDAVRSEAYRESPDGSSGEGRPASHERVLDAFAGIGYFAIPMARAGAAVTAIERNPAAFEYLLENAVRNDVTEALSAYRGDNREVIPTLRGDFDRVVMGYYDAFEYLDVTLPAVAVGGTLHMHEATPTDLVPARPVDRLETAARDAGRALTIEEVRQVKGYSEGVDHVVVDAVVE